MGLPSLYARLPLIVLIKVPLLFLHVSEATERPIIGVLCHEVDHNPPHCYIGASYIKAVEASGARAVPILLSRNEDYYKKLVDNLNGILFPGGDAIATTPGGYYEAARYIFDYVRVLQSKGENYPLLGVCLGFEALASLSNQDYANNRTLDECAGMQGAMRPLTFRADFKNSSLYGDVDQHIVDILIHQNVTANYHSYCVRPDKNLTLPWHILSLNTDGDGREFISSMELKGPTVGLQFHPEKNAWEWEKKHPSFEDGLLASRHFFDWLVTEARKNNHSFKDRKEEQDSLIYNYSPEFSGPKGSVFTQKYFFEPTSAGGMLSPYTFLTGVSLAIYLYQARIYF